MTTSLTGKSGGRSFGLGGLVAVALFLLISGRTICATLIDLAWWQEVGQLDAWWAQFYYQTGPRLIAAAVGFGVLWIVHARALKAAGTGLGRHPGYARGTTLGILVLAWMIASIHFGDWTAARYFASLAGPASAATPDPVFGKTLSFYFFALPFYQDLSSFVMVLLLFSTLGYWIANRAWSAGQIFRTVAPQQFEVDWQALRGGGTGVRVLAALTLVAFAVRIFLGRYTLAFEDHGFLTGVDYVAANIRLPLNSLLAAAAVAAAGLVVARRTKMALLLLILLPVQAILPGLVSSIYVKPNELTLQRSYIQYHMDATREAYGLRGSAEPKRFVATQESSIDVDKHRHLLENVRLWDWGAFHDTVSQIQPLRPYTYVDTDVDRYRIDGKLRQVMLTPRELQISQLGEARHRWPNSHVVYTHGYGIVAADANKITSDGLPKLFIQDAPPKVSVAGMKLTRPEIYFGEVEHEPVFVRTAQQEFNYPSGSENIHNRYDGTGGFPVGGFGMRLTAAIAYGDPNIILTSYLESESRMMIHRRISDRLETLAGFLAWDQDPYLVLTREGRLVWMVDGFSTSRSHPYSHPVATRNAGVLNYVRNAVKATVDAYTGETKLYVFAPEDPIIQAWQRLFPKLLLNASEMPAELREHARYPEWLFRIQAEVHLAFHMQDAEAFYNKVDVWDVASRQSGQASRDPNDDDVSSSSTDGKNPMAPTYLIGDVPGDPGDQPEFMLMLPFTPRGKDNLIGMMIGRCDGDKLGELVFLELPKEQLYYGPMQIESRITQDQNIAKDLSLWNQQGSQVLRGQMVVLPIDNKFFFAQPIYLQAKQARMPQLKKIVVAVGNRLIYTDTYEQALAELTAAGGSPAPASAGGESSAPATTSGGEAPPAGSDAARRLQSLRQRMERYRQFAAQGRWAEAGRELEALDAELKKP